MIKVILAHYLNGMPDSRVLGTVDDSTDEVEWINKWLKEIQLGMPVPMVIDVVPIENGLPTPLGVYRYLVNRASIADTGSVKR